MSDPVLDALLAELDVRRPVALVTVTQATGHLAGSLGRRLVVPADPNRSITGTLGPAAQFAALEADLAQRVRKRMADQADAPELITLEQAGDTLALFADVQLPPRHLIICGAGHIAAPLAAMARLCDFDVSVIDDRPRFASRERFPTATRIEAGPFRETLNALRERSPFDPRTFLVLVTRGHQHDVDCLLEVIDEPLAYIGMIGSQRRIRAVFALLEDEQGIPPSRFAGVYAPIGLDIAAHTPGEIAVAILAEMISVARGGRGNSLGDTIKQEREMRLAAARRSV